MHFVVPSSISISDLHLKLRRGFSHSLGLQLRVANDGSAGGAVEVPALIWTLVSPVSMTIALLAHLASSLSEGASSSSSKSSGAYSHFIILKSMSLSDFKLINKLGR